MNIKKQVSILSLAVAVGMTSLMGVADSASAASATKACTLFSSGVKYRITAKWQKKNDSFFVKQVKLVKASGPKDIFAREFRIGELQKGTSSPIGVQTIPIKKKKTVKKKLNYRVAQTSDFFIGLARNATDGCNIPARFKP